MHVEVDDGDARDAVDRLGVARGNRGEVEHAEAHRRLHLGVVPRGPYGEEGIGVLPRHDGIDRPRRAARGVHQRRPRLGTQHRVAVIDCDLALALLGNRLLDGGDVGGGMDARNRGGGAPGRLLAGQGVETRVLELGIDHADAVGPLRVVRTGVVVEAGGVTKEKRAQGCVSRGDAALARRSSAGEGVSACDCEDMFTKGQLTRAAAMVWQGGAK